MMKKGDRNKVVCAAIARSNTAVANDWLSERLAMGHSAYVSSLVNRIRQSKDDARVLKK